MNKTKFIEETNSDSFISKGGKIIMKSIICKINNIETGKKQEGRLFDQKDDWSFDKLIAWVYRNCQPAEIKIIPEKEVIAIFDERVETYYFKKEENKNETDNL